MQPEFGLSCIDSATLDRAFPPNLPIELPFMARRTGDKITASTKEFAKNPVAAGMIISIATDTLFPQAAQAETLQARRIRNGVIVGVASFAKEIHDLNSDIKAGKNTRHLAVNILQIGINGFAGVALGTIGTDVYDAFMATGKNISKFFSDFNNIVNFGAVTGCTYAIVRTTKIFSMAIDKMMNPLRGQFEEMRQDTVQKDMIYKIGIAYLGTPEPHRGDKYALKNLLRDNGIIDARESENGKIKIQDNKGKWRDL